MYTVCKKYCAKQNCIQTVLTVEFEKTRLLLGAIDEVSDTQTYCSNILS